MKYLLLFLPVIYCVYALIETDQHLGVNKYLRDLNSAGLLNYRQKRQSSVGTYYYVTQCDYNNTDNSTVTHSIEIFGKELESEESVQKAARLIHRMVRFMPKDIFIRLAEKSSVGLFDYRRLPYELIDELRANIPEACISSCNPQTFIQGENGTYVYDCSRWCTSDLYPYYQNYPLNFLWAYGNFSRTFVVESNVICQGFNPSGGSENYLVREFGLTVMTRGLDAGTLVEIYEAYSNARTNNIWFQVINMYDYFMKATLVWFNGVSTKDISRMNCKFYNNGAIPECSTGHHMRLYLRANDPLLYSILNRVYNNNRSYAQSYTEVCSW